MKGLTTMYDHKWKKWGIVLSAVSLAAMVAERLTGFIIFTKYNSTQHYIIFDWAMLLGFVLIMCSKEKYDDDRTKAIRLKSYQAAFNFIVAAGLAIALTTKLARKETMIEPEIMFLVITGGIILYLLMFHVGVYFDFVWDYEDKSLFTNLKNVSKNAWGMLAYFICAAITIAILMLLYR